MQIFNHPSMYVYGYPFKTQYKNLEIFTPFFWLWNPSKITSFCILLFSDSLFKRKKNSCKKKRKGVALPTIVTQFGYSFPIVQIMKTIMKWNMSGTNLLFCCPQEVQPCLAKKRLGRGSRKRCLGMFKGELKEEIGRGSLVKFS